MKTIPARHGAMEELAAIDREHVWHPYASMASPPPAQMVVSASGVKLRLADGRTLVDGISSWWSVIHGYNHPAINEAVAQQLSSMAHVMFGGLTHPPAAELAAILLSIVPAGLDKVFFCDSGSVSVEVAIKMAIQYWYSLGNKGKKRLLTVRSGYHGDTFHAMSVCDPVDGMHGVFKDALPEQFFADAPPCRFGGECGDRDIESFASIVAAHHDEIAAVILEPIVQAAGGMRFYSADYLRRVRELCDAHDVLLICDEVATGFGRTGKLFACEHAGIRPDILCVGKSLTGGYLGLAAALATDRVAAVISSGEPGLFMHGPTFMANPLACAAAVASIRLLLSMPWMETIREIESLLREGLAPCRECDGVADVRTLGAIGVVEMDRPVDREKVMAFFMDRGAWIRPFGNIIYLMPSYCINTTDMELLTGAITSAVRAGVWRP